MYGTESRPRLLSYEIKASTNYVSDMQGFPVEFTDPALKKAWEDALERLLRSKPNISKIRIRKISYAILATGRKLSKLPSEVTKQDLKEFFDWLESERYGAWTVHDYKLFAKQLFKLLKGKRFVQWIKIPNNIESKLGPEDLITDEELDRLQTVCDNLRDKAIIATLYECAFTPGEFLSLKIKNVTFDDLGARLHIEKGKHGPRTVRVIKASPHLATWIENHPVKDLESSLWINESTNSKSQGLKWQGLNRLLKRAARDANVKKRMYAYVFRHSRNTDLAKDATEAQLKQIAGWTQDSKMARIYVHLSGRDTDEAVFRNAGESVPPCSSTFP